ncbi:PREDICTED: RING finger protein 11-like [Dufourea novaeangliae]|uniref:RING finger protein 11-like n=1 Tax=Dufourea novaeangliae TaxID=178035 RepID=UPI0007672727|nr:PREDICTED: RING finger protein 11-like [Dufourea novaeangliae]
MGNCLKRSGSSQQDNTTLLGNNPDPALPVGSSREDLGLPIPYNELVSSYYPPTGSHLQSVTLNMGYGIGIGITVGLSNELRSLSDEELRVRIRKRLGLIQHLPLREYDGAKKEECVICMMELQVGEEVRYLPCMHTYHALCIDDWLQRSLTCPSCMEPLDAALISSYHPTT